MEGIFQSTILHSTPAIPRFYEINEVFKNKMKKILDDKPACDKDTEETIPKQSTNNKTITEIIPERPAGEKVITETIPKLPIEEKSEKVQKD